MIAPDRADDASLPRRSPTARLTPEAALAEVTAAAEARAALGPAASCDPGTPRPTLTRVAADFEDLITAAGPAALSRAGGPQHLTASCVVVDVRAEAVLLNHHRKAGLWGQFGGHIEDGDLSLRTAARREALEESGLAGFEWFSATAVDLHIHDLSRAFGTCGRHFDVVFAAGASVTDAPVVSAESVDVRWFPLTALPDELMPDLVVRLPELYSAAVAVSSPGRSAPRR